MAVVALAIAFVFGIVGVAYHVGGAAVAALAFFSVNAGLSQVLGGGRMVLGPTTLTTTPAEILLDVIEAFVTEFPVLNFMGLDWKVSRLKLDAQYIAHIVVEPTTSTYDAAQGGYKNGVQNARGLYIDVPITITDHPTCPLKFEHLASIKDNVTKYKEALQLAARALVKPVIDGILAGCTQRNFTHRLVIAAADFDYDALDSITTQATAQKMASKGRVLIVSSAYASKLGLDERMNSALFASQMQAGEGLRRWRNVGGFAEIIEYADMPTNNGAEVTGVTAEADDDILTKAAHGFETGDPVTFVSGTGFTGLVAATKYFAIKLNANTFKLATTYALAIAGTGINITADGADGVFQLTEDLGAIAFDRRAFAVLAGIPEGFKSDMAAALGITQTMSMEAITEPETKISMAAVSWQETGTGDLIWCPTFVWGKRLGRDGVANAADSLTDRAAIRICTR